MRKNRIVKKETEKIEVKKVTNPVKVMRLKCLDCCNGSITEVKLCTCEDCPLHPFRFGKNPYRKKVEYTEERKQQLAEQLAKGRNK